MSVAGYTCQLVKSNLPLHYISLPCDRLLPPLFQFLSLLPARVLRLLEFIGFSGDRQLGLTELTKGAASGTFRSPMCTSFLLFYHSLAAVVIGLFVCPCGCGLCVRVGVVCLCIRVWSVCPCGCGLCVCVSVWVWSVCVSMWVWSVCVCPCGCGLCVRVGVVCLCVCDMCVHVGMVRLFVCVGVVGLCPCGCGLSVSVCVSVFVSV